MTYKHRLVLVTLITIAVGGCATNENVLLIFGQTHTVGISMGGSATEQGADFTLGYKDRNFALVPVTVGEDQVPVTASAGENHIDALSVLGQFSVTKTGNDIGLGKFFATGIAAKTLADGFSCKMGSCPPEEDMDEGIAQEEEGGEDDSDEEVIEGGNGTTE